MLHHTKIYRKIPPHHRLHPSVVGCYITCDDQTLILKKCEGLWGFPAGKIHEGELPLNAAFRELFEETAMTPKRLSKGSLLYAESFVFHSYYTSLNEPAEIKLSKEHTEFLWATEEEIEDLPFLPGAKEAFCHHRALQLLPPLPAQEFYFIRHGETDVNADPKIKRVDYDLPLNRKGVEQAQNAREVVQELPLEQLFTSPISRALQTKELLNLSIPCKEDAAF